MSDPREQLERSWVANAGAWADAVRGGAIASRRVATDAAILEAVIERAPRRVLDLGCGEGWLTRALAARGFEVVGVDGSRALIELARESGGGGFLCLPYREIIAAPAALGGPFDVIAANFALLEEDLVPLLAALSEALSPPGALLIQTVHPWTSRGEAPYRDGWRTEHFRGFGHGFSEPMPWYYRTLESWVDSVSRGGFRVDRLREPRNPETGEPLSLLIEAVRDA